MASTLSRLHLSYGSLHSRPTWRVGGAGYDTRQVLAEDGRTPHCLDLHYNELRTACVTYEWPGSRIIHGVSKIPRQHHLEAEPRHLPGPETAIQDADIGMDSHQDNLVEVFLLAEVVDLLAAFTDTIEAYDVDGWMLA